MKNYFRYFVVVLVMLLIFRFFGFIMVGLLRYWFIVVPAILILYYMNRKKTRNTEFKKNTGLDPKDEVHLKEEPKVEDD